MGRNDGRPVVMLWFELCECIECRYLTDLRSSCHARAEHFQQALGTRAPSSYEKQKIIDIFRCRFYLGRQTMAFQAAEILVQTC